MLLRELIEFIEQGICIQSQSQITDQRSFHYNVISRITHSILGLPFDMDTEFPYHHLETIQKLTQNGAIIPDYINFVFIKCVWQGDFYLKKTKKFVEQYKPDIKTQNNFALNICMRNGYNELAWYLLNKGADTVQFSFHYNAWFKSGIEKILQFYDFKEIKELENQPCNTNIIFPQYIKVKHSIRVIQRFFHDILWKPTLPNGSQGLMVQKNQIAAYTG